MCTIWGGVLFSVVERRVSCGKELRSITVGQLTRQISFVHRAFPIARQVQQFVCGISELKTRPLIPSSVKQKTSLIVSGFYRLRHGGHFSPLGKWAVWKPWFTVQANSLLASAIHSYQRGLFLIAVNHLIGNCVLGAHTQSLKIPVLIGNIIWPRRRNTKSIAIVVLSECQYCVQVWGNCS